MATRRWIGIAPAVAQVDTFTPANVEIGDIFTLTATGEDGTTKAISFTATAATVANVCTGLVAVWNASADPLCTPITAAANGTPGSETSMKLTADTAGVPFSVASSTTNGGAVDDQTLTRAATTASSGPNDWAVALNWYDETVPVAADDVYFDEGAVDVLYSLNQSAVALTSLHVNQLYSGKIGGSAAAEYLRVGFTTLVIGEYVGSGNPAGSRRVKIDGGTSNATVRVHNSASTAEEANLPPVRLKLNNASATLTVLRGKVGLCVGTGETGQVDSVTIGYVDNVERDADVVIGSGVTLATVTKLGGSLLQMTACTTLTQKGGTCKTDGTGAITTVANYAGNMYPCSTGTVTNLECRGGLTDFTKSPRARTVTTPKLWGGATLVYDKDVVTMTNKPDPQEPLRMTTSRLYG